MHAFRVWKQHFTPPATEQLLLECTGKILDSKRGILDVHIFVSTNYISFLIDKRIPCVIPLINVICWCKAVKVNTPGVQPYVKLKSIPNQPGKAVPEGIPTAIQLYLKDEHLHMIFDMVVSYDRICYIFDSTWRSHHPQLMQYTAEFQRRQQAAQQQQQQQQAAAAVQRAQQAQMYNTMMGGFGGLGMTGFGGYNALGMTGFSGYGFNPMMTNINRVNPMMANMAPMNPMATLSPQTQSPTPQAPSPSSTGGPMMPPPAPTGAAAAAPTQIAVPQQPQQQLSGGAPRLSGTISVPRNPPPPRAGAPSIPGGRPPISTGAPSMAATVPAALPPEPEPDNSVPDSASQVTLGSLAAEEDNTQGAVGFTVVSSGSNNSSSASAGGASSRGNVSLLKGSQAVEWGNVPFEIAPGVELTFDLGSRQAPVDEELRQIITIRNSSGNKQSFCFEPIPSGKYSISAEPQEGKIPSGKEVTVLIKMTVLCTTEFKLELPLIFWKGDLKDAEKAARKHAMLTAEIESQLTTKLDSDELTLYSPPVGEGSFGTIYRGDYRGTDVAVKVLKYQNAITPDMINDFKSEIGIMEKLRHPCIINFIGAVHTPGKFAIVTEFCPFGNLNGAIKKPTFTYAHKLKALLDTAKGMNFLHRSNIMHRDLKPDNILMVSLEVRSAVICKISDFGTTRDVNRFSHEMSFTKGVGTPIFMAPELLSGRRDYEKSADVYSFGMMMVNLITLKQPFEGDPNITSAFQFANYVIEGHRPSLKGIKMEEDYRVLMEACWSSEPAKRPQFDEISKKIDAMLKVAKANMK